MTIQDEQLQHDESESEIDDIESPTTGGGGERAAAPPAESTRSIVVLLSVIVVLLTGMVAVGVLQLRQDEPTLQLVTPPTVAPASDDADDADAAEEASDADDASDATSDSNGDTVIPSLSDEVQAVLDRWSETTPNVASVFESQAAVVAETAINMCGELTSSTLDEYLDNASERIDNLIANPDYGLDRDEWISYYTEIAGVYCPQLLE